MDPRCNRSHGVTIEERVRLPAACMKFAPLFPELLASDLSAAATYRVDDFAGGEDA